MRGWEGKTKRGVRKREVGDREKRDSEREGERGREDGGRERVCVRVHIDRLSFVIDNLGHV
jgi:hypothetical protein